ncbi:MAG: hypothetical protein WDO14_03075 [Bacteroidota bacterium]
MKKISNYHDLVAEKARVEQRLALLKRDIHSEIEEIKQRLSPVTRIVGLLSGNGASNNQGAQKDSLLKSGLKAGAALGMDLLIGPNLAKAGMLTRLIVPPLLRNISSGIINRFRKKK